MSVSAVLYLPVGLSRESPENHGKQNDEGHKAEHHQRQLHVQKEHGRQNTEDHKKVLQKVYQKVGKHQGDRIGIVGGTGDKFSHRNLIELLVGKSLDMGKKLFSHR